MVWEELLLRAIFPDDSTDGALQVENIQVAENIVRLNIYSELLFINEALEQIRGHQYTWDELSEAEKKEFKEELEEEVDVKTVCGDMNLSDYYSQVMKEIALLSIAYQIDGLLPTRIYEANLDKISLLKGKERTNIVSCYSYMNSLKNVNAEFRESVNEHGIIHRDRFDADIEMRRDTLVTLIESELEMSLEYCKKSIDVLEENI